MVSISFAERFSEHALAQDGWPEVVAFATTSGASVRNFEIKLPARPEKVIFSSGFALLARTVAR
jgi:hypothetical protein